MGFVTRFAGKNRRMRKRLHFRQRLVRSLHIIPNLFTLGNAFFGFCSIILAAHGNIVGAAYFILMGALMDGLDGRVARFMKISSDFGTQLDSLCDTVTFCLAPSILLYFWELKKLGVLGVVIAGMFLLSGILRLARFNITHDEQFIISTGVTT
ncbi:hypothetical protein EBZ39_11795, partial [bacterium]|nr:hypothetical protein [bacterium]